MKKDITYEWHKNCKEFIINYYKKNFDIDLEIEDVFVVWACKTLQNRKALLSTTVSGDGMYFECTYNGDKEETYFDAYKKQENIRVSDEMLKALSK